jgi:hypothetical protein
VASLPSGILRGVAALRWFFVALALNLATATAFAHQADSLAPTPSAPPPAPKSPVGAADARPNVWPFVLVGAGALTLGTGIWLVHSDHTEAAAPTCTAMPGGHTTCPYATTTTWQGWAFVALGAQLAIAGVAWRLYEVHNARARISLAAGFGDLRLVGTF